MTNRELNGGAGVLCACLCACFSTQAAESSYQDWQFTNRFNPAVPTEATNTSGVATAAVVVGFAGAGWQQDLPGFGEQTGLWDLGLQNQSDLGNDTRGRVLLSIPNPVAAGGNSYTDLGLRVVQFFVGSGFYDGDLTFSIPGAAFLGRTTIEALPGTGSWVEDAFRWRLEPSPQQVSLSITGSVYGTFLDRIIVETVSVPAPLKLMITSVAKSNQNLAISWVGGLPPYQIYVASNLLGGGLWQPVGLPVPGTNAEIPLAGPAGFVRVRGSN